MGCKCAKVTDEYHGWECSITDGECIYMYPDSKRCAKEYGEGPDAPHDNCEDCENFYLENHKRCCTKNPLALIDGDIVPSKYIDDDTLCCGGFKAKYERR